MDNIFIASVYQNNNLEFGLKNQNDEWISTTKFDWLKNYEINGFYYCKINDKMGLIDSNCNVIIEPIYDSLWDCMENIVVMKDEKYGLKDYEGNYLLDLIYDSISVFNIPNIVKVKQNDKYGLFNLEKGTYLIEPIFDNIIHLDKYGFLKVYINNKHGYVDIDGKWLIEPKFEFIYPFDSNGLAKTEFDNNKYGFINRKGDWIIHPIFDFVHDFKNNDFAPVYINPFWGLLSKDGKWKIQPKFNKFNFIDENNIIVCFNDKYGLIDINENWLIESKFDQLNSFKTNEMAEALLGEKWGIINRKGEWIIDANFESIELFAKYSLAKVCVDDKWGIIDLEMNWIFLPIFNNIDSFCDTHNVAVVSINQKFGLVDNAGKTLVQPSLKEIGKINKDGYAIVQSETNKYGIINVKGNWVVQSIYDKLEDIDESGFTKATVGNKYGWIDLNGNWVMPITNDIPRNQYDVYKFTKEFIYSELREDEYFENVNGLYCLDEIDFLKMDFFNNNFNFIENIEYLILFDDSINNDCSSGLALVKKDYEYLLLCKGFREKPIVFSLSHNQSKNFITSMYYDYENCILSIETRTDNITSTITKEFYNIKFLHRFVHLQKVLSTMNGWIENVLFLFLTCLF